MVSRNPTPIRVLLVDDYRIVLWALEKLIDNEKPRMEVVGCVTNCTEALKRAKKVFPDVIVLNIDLTEESALDAISGLIGKSKARVLVLTRSRDPSTHDNAVLAGASGIVENKDPAKTILKAIEKVHAGQLWLNHITTGWGGDQVVKPLINVTVNDNTFVPAGGGSTPTCALPPATIQIKKISGTTTGLVNEPLTIQPADNNSQFRVVNCQYMYNLDTSSLSGAGRYEVDVMINSTPAAGPAFFDLR